MKTKLCYGFFICLAVVCCFGTTCNNSDFSHLEGKEVDIALSAYHYYANDSDNPIETKWIAECQEGVLCGLVWEETRTVSKIVLDWSKCKGRKKVPSPEDLIIEKFVSYDQKSSWWQGKWERYPFKAIPMNSSDRVVLEFEKPVRMYMLRIRTRLTHEPDKYSIPKLSAYDVRPLEWEIKKLNIFWMPEHELSNCMIRGQLSAYNGDVSLSTPLGEKVNLKSDNKWTMKKVCDRARGIQVQALTCVKKEIKEPTVFINGRSNAIHKGFHFLYQPMSMSGNLYYKGFSTSSPARLTIYHPDRIVSLRSFVGIDWNHHTLYEMSGSAVFKVMSDEKELYNSGIVHVADGPKIIDIDFEANKKIDIVIEKGDANTLHNHADWANIYFKTQSGKEVCMDDLQWIEFPLDQTDNYRTVVTIQSDAGSFSFLPDDVKQNKPLYIPNYGVVIAQADGMSYEEVLKTVNAGKTQTLRQKVVEMPEQTWQEAMQAIHDDIELPEIPDPGIEPPCTIQVPEQQLTKQWKLSAWNQKRRIMQTADENWLILCYPYTALAQESYLTIRALDYLGMHDVARGGIMYWVDRQGQAKPAGLFHDAAGCMTLSNFMDEIHGIGAGAILWNIGQHYQLTGDRQWLREIKPNILATSEWMQRQSRHWTDASNGKGNPWFEGLMPPAHIGDISEYRMWYMLKAFYYAGLQSCGQALEDIDQQASKQILKQSQSFKKSILNAVERSVMLAPVKKLRTGVARQYIPTATHLRGLASDIVPAQSMGHGGPIWGDVEFGALSLVKCGILSPFDNRVDGFLDVLEEDLMINNSRLYKRPIHYDPAKNWFERGGVHYQNGYMDTAMIYLMRDEIENFIRIFYNQMASVLVPGPYTFKEHTEIGHAVNDKIFEESAFLERLRNMLVMELDNQLWLCKGTPKSWLNDGETIKVDNAPTYYGNVSFKITSKLNENIIEAMVSIPNRIDGRDILLRLRHPNRERIKKVTLNNKQWNQYDSDKIVLNGLSGYIEIKVKY